MQDRISNCDGLLVFVSVFSSMIQYYISIMESVLTMVSYSYVSNVSMYIFAYVKIFAHDRSELCECFNFNDQGIVCVI